MRVGLLAATLAVLIPLSALADDQMIGVDIIEESQGFSMWVDIMSVGEKTRGDGLMSVFTAPVEIGWAGFGIPRVIRQRGLVRIGPRSHRGQRSHKCGNGSV